jgi:hypothetical protein
MEKSKDQDRGKGAMGHRDEDIELKNTDSNLAG